MTNFSNALTATPEEARDAYDGIADSVARTLHTLGVSVVTPSPVLDGALYEGSLPEDLDEVSYDRLSQLMRCNVEWNRYLQGHRTTVNNELNVLKSQTSAVRSAIIKQRGKESLECDVRYLALSVELCELESLSAALDTAIQGAKDAYKLLSRLITIRGQDQERSHRVDNFERGFATGQGRRRS